MNYKQTFSLLFIGINLSLYAQQITLNDIYKSGVFRQQSVYGLKSMADGVHYTAMDEDGGVPALVKFSYSTGERVSTVLSEKTFQEWAKNSDIHMDDYEFSQDEKLLLIATDQEQIYRHSTRASYYVVDLINKSVIPLDDSEKQRLATFSPDGIKVAYVKGNDIYVRLLNNGGVAKITKDGMLNQVINGYPDWVYEEEFSFNKGFEWSPDGGKIAYYKFIESEVPEFNMQEFTQLYPQDYRYKYPKAGEKNSEVSIHLYDVASFKTTDLQLGEYEYIPRIKWTNTSQFLSVFKMPRLQNELEIVLVETSTGATKSIYKEKSDTYIEISNDLYFTKDNTAFIWKSERDGFFHFYKYDLNGQNGKAITSGKYEVSEMKGFDENTQTLYYTARMKSPMDQELYSITINGGTPKLLSPENGTSDADFSAGQKFYILFHSTANTPVRVSLNSSDGKEIRLLQDNADFITNTKVFNLSPVEFFEFTTSENVKLNGWMMKPMNMDKKKKYPVLMTVYGGPGSQTVTNGMGGNYAWHQMLCQMGYIIVSVDNRGTGARGRDFRNQTYKQLGNLESTDQIEAAKWLGKQSYVDPARIGIWGWSYGGYMSSLCLFKGAGAFKTAIAVAPVSNWRFYDSIYTERYMGLPSENGAGYDDNSPINHVSAMSGNLLLVHGTGDDNVHYQNSVELVDALIAADKQFGFMMYPERNHGIYGGNTRFHLFTMLTNYIVENL